MSFEKISVIGLGYIGLPTAAVFADNGKKVIGVDVNQHAVDTINRGEIHIVEPGLESVVKKAVENGCLKAVIKAEPADAFLIAVPTPFKGNNYEPDLSYIESAAKAIAPVLKPGDLVILESTSPVGATEQMMAWLKTDRTDLSFPDDVGEASDIRIAHCPERVLPGQVLQELVENDRVIGGITSACSNKAVELYKSFVKGDCVVTSARTAEMAKLTENSFRDVNIAFANELSILCEDKGIDVWELISLANRHPRVEILNPGAGVGGHCIAVDPWFIVSQNPDKARLIGTAREVNDSKPYWVIEQTLKEVNSIKLGLTDRKPRVACMGLSFKPNIDDLRESPALNIARILKDNAEIEMLAVEPNLHESSYEGIELVDYEQAILWADIVLFLTAHDTFFDMKIDKENTKIIDVCNALR